MITRSKITGRAILLGASLFFYFVIGVPVLGQNSSKHHEFLAHLKNIRAYDEGVLYIQQSIHTVSGDLERDTLNYFLGKFNYYQQNLTESIDAFDRVGISSPFHQESQLLSAYQEVFQGNVENGLQKFTDFTPQNELMEQVINLELAGITLINRDLIAYREYGKLFNNNHWQLTNSQDKLKEVATSIADFKNKSPFLAATLSAIIPGSGRMYYGKVGQGIMVLLAHSIFALQAFEAYEKDGPKTARFIIYGSLFSGFYVANIWGSALGVKIRRDEFNEQTDHTLLVTMHVPLRSIFD